MTEWIISILLLIAMLGFVSTVAVCKYLLRGDIIE
nr:monovalent cation/H+ antiporter complex subunit F [Litorilituus sediminis]